MPVFAMFKRQVIQSADAKKNHAVYINPEHVVALKPAWTDDKLTQIETVRGDYTVEGTLSDVKRKLDSAE